MLGASYTYAQATDNSLGINSHPSDAFVGTVPAVTETGDRPLERQRRIHARQRHARAGGRHVPERTRSRQGAVRSGDRSRVPGQRHGRTAVADSGQRHLPRAERLPFQPGARERRAGRSRRRRVGERHRRQRRPQRLHHAAVRQSRHAVRQALQHHVAASRRRCCSSSSTCSTARIPRRWAAGRTCRSSRLAVPTQVLPGREGQIGFRIEW